MSDTSQKDFQNFDVNIIKVKFHNIQISKHDQDMNIDKMLTRPTSRMSFSKTIGTGIRGRRVASPI